MKKLNLDPNINNVDEFYAQLLAAHEGLSEVDSEALNARLILILANHIGDLSTLVQAIHSAKS